MHVHVAPAGPEDEARLCALLELYVYDFSEGLELDVEEDGRFRVPAVASYWTDPGSHAFLVRCDGKLAGFALVQERSRLTGEAGVRDMAEFFVLRRYRRRGVGQQVARWLFDRFRGSWEVRQRAEQPAATEFWRRVIRAYTSERFDEVRWDDVRFRGPVQRFDNTLLE